MTTSKPISQKEQRLNERLLNEAQSGNTETVKALLAAGADVHARDDLALSLAADNGHTETVKALLATGADVCAGNDRALYWAAMHDHTEMVKALLANGADVRARNDRALYWAARDGHAETAQILAAHIFAADSWRGKSRAEIEAEATNLYGKINDENIRPERLRAAGMILLDSALACWERVRPAPPKLALSPFPAQPMPL